MKKLLFLIAFVAMAFSVNAQIKVISNGNVGINVANPTYKLQVNGNGHFSTGLSTTGQLSLDFSYYT